MTRQLKSAVFAVEVLILTALFIGLQNHVSREADATVRRNRAIAEAIARHASRYFADLEAQGKAQYELRDMNEYLDAQLGRAKLFDDDLRRPASFEIYRIQDLRLGRVRPEIIQAVDYTRPFTVRRDDQNITVTVPFALEGQSDYYGLVRIPTPLTRIYAVLFERNLPLYLMLAVLYISQLILATLVLSRRRREILFERGYLREHALGALKLQRQILDGIINDHEGLQEPARAPAPRRSRSEESETEETGEETTGVVVHLPDKNRNR